METERDTFGIRKILLYQAVIGGLIILAWVLDSTQAAMAALFGMLIAGINSWLLAWRSARLQNQPAGDPQRDLRAFYFAAFERFVIVIMLFTAGLGVLQLAALPLLSGFIAGLAVHTVLSFKTGSTSHGR